MYNLRGFWLICKNIQIIIQRKLLSAWNLVSLAKDFFLNLFFFPSMLATLIQCMIKRYSLHFKNSMRNLHKKTGKFTSCLHVVNLSTLHETAIKFVL